MAYDIDIPIQAPLNNEKHFRVDEIKHGKYVINWKDRVMKSKYDVHNLS